MTTHMDVIGVPTSAGAHWAGSEKTPDALRRAGLIKSLRRYGVKVTDLGDLPVSTFKVSAEERPNNRSAVETMYTTLAQRVAAREGTGPLLVIGGDCTVTIGALAGLKLALGAMGLIYVDGHTDLNTPATTRSGIFDSMGMAHILGLGGDLPTVVHGRGGLLPEDHVVFYGYNPDELNDVERQTLEQISVQQIPLSDVQQSIERSTQTAVSALMSRVDRFIIHFDVDVIDFMNLSVADVPQYNSGLTLDEVMTSISIFMAQPAFAGLVVTEFNPDRDPSGRETQRFVDALASAVGRPRDLRRFRSWKSGHICS